MIAYPYLPPERTINYVPSDHPWMHAAREFAREHATDRHMPTGAVIVRDESILGSGANRVPITNAWLMRLHKERLCVRRALKIPSGEKYWLCPGCASSKEHAEARAVRDVIQKRHDARGAELYLWGHWWACKPCWDSLLSLGIERIYLMEGSERLFNHLHADNIIGRQFD